MTSGYEAFEVLERDGPCLLLHAAELKEEGDLERGHLVVPLGLRQELD